MMIEQTLSLRGGYKQHPAIEEFGMTMKRNAFGRYVEETELAKSLRKLNLKFKNRSPSMIPQRRRKTAERTIYLNSHGREMMGPLEWSYHPDEY